MIVHSEEQGSAGWLTSRLGVVTASRFKDARDRLADKPEKVDKKGNVTAAQRGAPSTKQVAYAATVAIEGMIGEAIERTFVNWEMQRGTEEEPNARRAYDLQTGNIVEQVGFITTDDGAFGYSPDGLIGDDGLLEIKTIFSAARIMQIVGRGDYSDFLDQCLGGLWITGRQWVDLVIWVPALQALGRGLTIYRIHRKDHEDAIADLECDLVAFHNAVLENRLLLSGIAA